MRNKTYWKKPVVYVAGKLRDETKELVDENIERAKQLADVIVGQGFSIISPHAIYKLQIGINQGEEFWLDATQAMLNISHAVAYVRHGVDTSIGTKRELSLAGMLEIPVFSEEEVWEGIMKRWINSLIRNGERRNGLMLKKMTPK